MTKLTADKLFYRHDHPEGCLFRKGQVQPDPADGWVAKPDEVVEPPARTFECTTLDGFQDLVDALRETATATRTSYEAEIERLEGDKAALITALTEARAGKEA